VIQAVISDFGGVLTSPLHEGLAAYQQEAGVSLEELGWALARSAEEHGEHPLFALERGQISEAEFLRRLGVKLEDGFELERLRTAYFEHLEPNPPMIDFMRDLRRRGLRMALCTNNVREWESLWRSKLPELEELFEVVVDSAFVGLRKPEREIYLLTLERLGGLRPDRCLFVDDLEVNCEAARGVGMKAVHFERTDQAIEQIEAALGHPPG
jgi:putative hydrolase of the HAD superfamily